MIGAGATGTAAVRIWLATAPVDMRRSFDRLAEQVRSVLAADPTCGHLFVFRNRTGERVKVLWRDTGGYVLYYKRLERGTFQFPAAAGQAIAIGPEQLKRLLSGCPIEST